MIDRTVFEDTLAQHEAQTNHVAKRISETVNKIMDDAWHHISNDWINKDALFEEGIHGVAESVDFEMREVICAAIERYLQAYVPIRTFIGESDYSCLPDSFTAECLYDGETHTLIINPNGRD